MNIHAQTFEAAKEVAARWQGVIETSREHAEKKFHDIMIRMLKEPRNKVFLIELLDQSFRSGDSGRVADQLEYLFEKYEGTDIFTAFESWLVWLFRHAGIYIPELSVPLFIRYLRNDISNVVIKGEASPLIRHINSRRREGTRVNVNIIGESVLGEKEARSRVEKYVNALQTPEIDYISIKISTIFSQISPLAHDWSIEQISRRLESVYRAAMQNTFTDAGGSEAYKFVNLDMEEYRDLSLTVGTFMKTLSKEEFMPLHAGIVLQAYLPDSFEWLKRLVVWAQERVEKGGAPIKVRLVKGANQEMELTEASLRGWPCVTYLDKAKSDANYKILMDYLLSPEVAPYVHTGLASHNLFDHALGMLLARERGVEAYYTAEMLEGMSETAYRVLKAEGLNVILYAPTATLETFTNAIAYLVRRFDENTAEQNFLRHSFGLTVGSKAWERLLKSYDDALKVLPKTPLKPFRTQDRNLAPEEPDVDVETYRFENESDTDFALPQNRRWAEAIRDRWSRIADEGGFHAVPVIGGEELAGGERIDVIDKSQYAKKVVVGSYVRATADELERAVEIAKADPDGWRGLSLNERQRILMGVAHEFRKSRGELIGVAAAEAGKIFTETDVEISEAIDFLNFYPYSVRKIAQIGGMVCEGTGVGLVVSPWNFPIAIPTGGVAAALAAGNTVILKPSSDAVLSGYRLCQCFWNAGVSKNSLQFAPTSGALAGEKLVANPDVDFVIFTGGEATAYEMLKRRPDLHLSAETGGKDATIVTALADRDQAVKNVVASAFNNSGQKCSATSLLVLERELYEDPHFKEMLVDAAASLQVGSAWEFQNRIGPLVQLPSGNLEHALNHLDEGEQWVIAPSCVDDENPYMLKPSIRWGTQRGDFCHMNELFGPVLSVMCADSLEEAIELVNATGYGLTSGIESLDAREKELWKSTLRAGNLYLNRMTTGAIVLRQPFGGMGKSAIGSGKKAGGLNYVAQFMALHYSRIGEEPSASHPYIDRLKKLPESGASEVAAAVSTAGNFAYWLEREFLQAHDYSHIRGESNEIRYLPLKRVLLRFEAEDSLYEMLGSIAAVKITGAALLVSIPATAQSEALAWLSAHHGGLLDEHDRFSRQDEAVLIGAMTKAERVRFLNASHVTPSIYESAAERTIHIAAEPFIAHGRIELMHYFIEQSVSDSYHRYGNLGPRGLRKKDH